MTLFIQILGLALALLFTLHVLSKKARHTSVSLAWIFSFFALPILSPLFYLLTGFHTRRFHKRRRRLSLPGPMFLSDLSSLQFSSQKRSAKLAETLSGFPVSSGNTLTFLNEGEQTFQSLLEAIENAKDHVHLEYYIFEPDETGMMFRDALCKKAQSGVRCRVLVDYVGSVAITPAFIAPFREAGVEFEYFSKVKLSRPWKAHLRNHRKIAVIDGKIGFIGSQNIGDEYSRRKKMPINWRDSVVKIEGPGVHQLQTIFLSDWKFSNGGKEIQILDSWDEQGFRGSSSIQALPTSPLQDEFVLEKTLLEIISTAELHITILTPYFVPSHALILALELASSRGVEIMLLLPVRTDSKIIDRVGQSWCNELAKSGIQVRVHEKKFLHGKVITIDGKTALLGSANMDQRSFHVNFECSLLIYDPAFVEKIEKNFKVLFDESESLWLNRPNTIPLWDDIQDGFLRLLSPLL